MACARRNLGSRGRVFEGDLLAPLPASLRDRVELLVVNAPYVPTDAIRLLAPEAREHEPLVALDGGADGLDVVRRAIASAVEWLAPWGYVVVEISERQVTRTLEVFARAGLYAYAARSDELDASIVVGTRSGFPPLRLSGESVPGPPDQGE